MPKRLLETTVVLTLSACGVVSAAIVREHQDRWASRPAITEPTSPAPRPLPAIASPNLPPDPRPAPAPEPEGSSQVLPGFRGDTGWIHRREGHVGAPYWPGGLSGVTLDPGIDLGHAEPWLIELAYRHRTTPSQWRAMLRAMGVRGESANRLLERDPALRSVQIDQPAAAEIFPYLLKPYWRALRRRFPTLTKAYIPAEVQTALLSLAYNRGTWNRDLASLHLPLQQRDWSALAARIEAMQQDHELAGIRRRRRVEGFLISGHSTIPRPTEAAVSANPPSD
ncbi:MAG: hypothetical protein AAF604_05430 [Acidobacteriota bacterium]